ncbi:protein CELLULOSE SYNTHASE INTERACTIVE 3 isoform X2 [Andrographis paniculata]|uniref:protein CELLULOSE SYNTHASE INTERACTIVE 3 isoform X2 n=1 Tax=Andrographis paniculata TaxID=175694 RepID=UPI0021E98EEB|nr:protein CELLULOSE SYNTHASE INTERACTIVE 3 isoform X2 [Andrographis paniculata]
MSKLFQKAANLTLKRKESNGNAATEDLEKALSRVAKLFEQLHSSASSPQERELTTACLLGVAKSRKEARDFIVSHGQAMPLLVSILRNGTQLAKINVAEILRVLCKDKDLRVKVLLGGCIPPLLSLLKYDSIEARKAAAEAIYELSSNGLSEDLTGMKIFVTEGVVPSLWEQLYMKKERDKVVEGFITGALKNLCGDKDGYWKTTLDADGVNTIVSLLSCKNPTTQANAASLLARLTLSFTESIQKIIDAGAIKILLGLLGPKTNIFVRASSAEALEALTKKSSIAKQVIVDSQGTTVLIGAIIAPSKEGMQGEGGQALQQHSTQSLANICGGMSELMLYLGELAQSPRLAAPVADIIGALAYTLMVYKQSGNGERFDSTKVESILVMLLKPRDNKLVQERILEAMASLYGNPYLSVTINQSAAKRVLVGLVTMAAGDSQEYLILSLIELCANKVSVWEALGKRDGIQILISSLGLSSEQHQEYAAEMLAILTEQVDDSRWAITAAGGIPPLVQLIEVGSLKAKESAAYILLNLGSHNEDIRDCIERSGAIPALLWLLRNGGPKGQEASANALIELIRLGDSATINQLLDILVGDTSSSKASVIKVLGHVLSTASHADLVNKNATANMGLRSLVQVLNSSDEEAQGHAASILADLFSKRKDICDSLATDEVINPCMKLLTSKSHGIATQSARALGALSPYIADRDVQPLIKLARTSSIQSAETAMAAVANLLLNPHVAGEALAEDVVSAITRLLGEGSPEGKRSASRALCQLLKHFQVGDVLGGYTQCRSVVLALVESLKEMDLDTSDAADALEVVALLSCAKQDRKSTYAPWSALSNVFSSLQTLVNCLCRGSISVQDKVIGILSRLTGDQPAVLGDLLVSNTRSISVLASRIIRSSSLEVRVGGAALLICATKENKVQSMDALEASGYMNPLIRGLANMTKQSSSLEIKIRSPSSLRERKAFQDGGCFDVPDPATVFGSTVSLWLLCILSSFHPTSKITMMEVGVLEALSDKLSSHANSNLAAFEDTEGVWISTALAASLFQDPNVASSHMTMEIIPSLSVLLKSDELIVRYFAAQAMASLVCHDIKGINLAMVNSGAVPGLTALIGFLESDRENLIALSQDFSLARNPEVVVLEKLFQVDDIKFGSIAWKAIPLLVDLLKPIPERPEAPPIAVRLLTQIADGNDINKQIMAEAGALDALTKYLSLSPADLTEATISELLRILFSNPDLVHYDAAISCMSQLIAILRLGSRSARLSAARALSELFDADHIRNVESSSQAIQPLADMLDSTTECEQKVALGALLKLTSDNKSKAAMLAEVEGNLLHNLSKILTSSMNLQLKGDAAELCYVLFDDPKARETQVASECTEPLILLMQSGEETAVESAVCAFERLLDNEQMDVTSAHDVVGILVGLVSGSNHRLIEASICALIKLGKDRTPRKLDMVNAGIIDNCLELLPMAPNSLCAMIAELFRILTNSSVISKGPAAVKIVEPLFSVLLRTDFGLWGQHSSLQALVNILEKPQSLSAMKLTPSEVIEPLISFLESPSQAIQQLGTELLSHLLALEHYKQDITTKGAVVPLVQLAGIGILNLQQTAIKALENVSLSWPKAVSDAGGIFELSKVIIQEDPLPPEALWESAALVLTNILQSDADYYLNIPAVALVKMLHSSHEGTVKVALNALLVQENTEGSSAELMVEAGAVDALLDLMRSHHCEEGSVFARPANKIRNREVSCCTCTG